MNPEQKNPATNPANAEPDSAERRKVLERFGKFAAYAAPFTVLAFAEKADAATGTGPHKHIAH